MKWFAQSCFFPGLILAVVATGCTANHYRKSADKAAYAAIKQKSPSVKNMDSSFTIEQTNDIFLGNLPVVTNVVDYLGKDGESERGARILPVKGSISQ